MSVKGFIFQQWQPLESPPHMLLFLRVSATSPSRCGVCVLPPQIWGMWKWHFAISETSWTR